MCYCYSLCSCGCLRECICLHVCVCVCVCVYGTVEQSDVALCPRYIWVTTLSVSLQPLSFSPLSTPIPASVHSTRLMVCVIHSDSSITSHLSVLLERACVCVCVIHVSVHGGAGERKKRRTGGKVSRGYRRIMCVIECVCVCVLVKLYCCCPLSLHSSTPPPSQSKTLKLTLSSPLRFQVSIS